MVLSGRLIGGLFFGLSFAFWVIFLAGVGRSQSACVSNDNGRRMLLGNSVEFCGNHLGLEWWVVFFQLFNTIIAALLAAGIPFIANFKQTLVVFMTMCTALLMYVSHNACLKAYNLDKANSSEAALDGARVLAAGSVTCCILNMIWFICHTEGSGQWAFSFEAAPEENPGAASQSNNTTPTKSQKVSVALSPGSTVSYATNASTPRTLPVSSV